MKYKKRRCSFCSSTATWYRPMRIIGNTHYICDTCKSKIKALDNLEEGEEILHKKEGFLKKEKNLYISCDDILLIYRDLKCYLSQCYDYTIEREIDIVIDKAEAPYTKGIETNTLLSVVGDIIKTNTKSNNFNPNILKFFNTFKKMIKEKSYFFN